MNKKREGKWLYRLCFVLIVLLIITISGYCIYSYNISHFDGTVTEKYQTSTPFVSIEVKTNHIKVKAWFGEKDFCVDDETYESLEIGKKYSFQKDKHINHLSLE